MFFKLELLCDRYDPQYKVATSILHQSNDFYQESTYIYFCEGSFQQETIELLSKNSIKYSIKSQGSL